MSLWLALRFPQLMIDAAALQSPQPSAIRDQHRLVAVNTAAADQGVQPGMRPGTALALCEGLQIYPRHAEAEQSLLTRHAQALLSYTPMICIDGDCLLLEIGPSLRLFHGVDSLIAQLRGQFTSQSPYQIGLGHTPVAAKLLSHYPLAQSRAAVVIDHRTHHVDKANTRQKMLALLAQHPLADLPLPPALKKSLLGPGLRRLGDIFTLPTNALQRRFGKSLTVWLEKLRGDLPDLRQAIVSKPRFTASLSFDEPVSVSQHLHHPMQQLLKQMSQHLLHHQQQVRAIRWLFLPLRGQAQRLLVRRASANHQAAKWFDLSLRHLERQHLLQPVLKLTLQTGRPLPMDAPPEHLFASLERPAADELLEKLANLPGLSLYRPAPADSHLPEHNDINDDPLGTPPRQQFAVPALLDDAPLWLLEQPQPLRCRNCTPYWRGSALELLPGARQLNEPWWQQGLKRHYRIGRHPLGIHCWVFFTTDESGPWFLHGFF
ncbi:DNA polymerase Y family protein [Alcanivorax sp. 1008]|uniref:Y-family DNA polymerase n=1 Tax=Alcanivorax sp. 1008 TaxID=2816853 RepID=UPI001E1218A5|nr:DNA polymerase Y family protein [Alcanivorax sp. 1008]MCC1497806.1 DNA polymerase Y family protein [Alcanivorax sp. 1008]